MDFRYCSVSDSDGLVEFCMRGRLNPQRIPVFLVVDGGGYPCFRDAVPPEEIRKELEPYLLFEWVGLETNYDAGGIITEDMIRAVLGTLREEGTP
jgi:hypothetical protein